MLAVAPCVAIPAQAGHVEQEWEEVLRKPFS
jgi:hypothetical protein